MICREKWILEKGSAPEGNKEVRALRKRVERKMKKSFHLRKRKSGSAMLRDGINAIFDDAMSFADDVMSEISCSDQEWKSNVEVVRRQLLGKITTPRFHGELLEIDYNIEPVMDSHMTQLKRRHAAKAEARMLSPCGLRPNSNHAKEKMLKNHKAELAPCTRLPKGREFPMR